MQLEDFEKQGKSEWISKESVSTVLGDLHLELNVHDRAGPPDEAMLKLADELRSFAQAHAELVVDSIYAHYRDAEDGDRLAFWDVPGGLGRDEILSQVESVTLCVSRDCDAEERPYEAYVHVSPNWDLEHDLHLRYANGQLSEFDPMSGEMHA